MLNCYLLLAFDNTVTNNTAQNNNKQKTNKSPSLPLELKNVTAVITMNFSFENKKWK